MRRISENVGRQSSAGVLANATGIAIGAHGESQLEFWTHSEFILEVEPESVEGHRLDGTNSEVVLGKTSD